MKARIILAVTLFLGTPIGQALACSQCFTAPDSKTTEHMAAAIWVMMGLIMSVMGGALVVMARSVAGRTGTLGEAGPLG